jgi:AcrR family transcriptional regulator
MPKAALKFADKSERTPDAPVNLSTPKRRARPKTANKLNRRDKIINSAIELIVLQGFAEVTAGEIAAHAGVSLALIWYHFKSKEDIRDHADEVVLSIISKWLPDVSLDLHELAETYGRDIALRPDFERVIAYLRFMLLDQGPRCFNAAAMLHDRVKHLFGSIDPMSSSAADRQREVMLVSMIVGPLILKSYFDKLYNANLYDVEYIVEGGKIQADIVETLLSSGKDSIS